jgi:peptidoglycan/LPS O-acetylase OafA/YrhL
MRRNQNDRLYHSECITLNHQMARHQTVNTQRPKNKRLLLFDLLRIGAIAAIVLYHYSMIYNFAPVVAFDHFFNLGILGISVMVFVSGAVIEYSYPCLEGAGKITEFYGKRLTRVYPALWMSLILALVLAPVLLTMLPASWVILEFSGFTLFSGHFGSQINGVAWFIGLIVALYILFPFLSASIRRYPYPMLLMLLFTEVTMLYCVNVTPFPLLAGVSYWWQPACYLMEFSLGIFIMQQGFYPKTPNTSGAILFFADISFYVFLVHNLPGFATTLAVFPLLIIIGVAMLSWFMMIADKQIQTGINAILFRHPPATGKH